MCVSGTAKICTLKNYDLCVVQLNGECLCLVFYHKVAAVVAASSQDEQCSRSVVPYSEILANKVDFL
jgi:hypothetical protein